jgi:hypothetical protein
MSSTGLFERSTQMLRSSRMLSLKNAAARLGVSMPEATRIIVTLETMGYLRIVKPKTCSASCSSCDSCSTESVSGFTGDEIIISLLFDRTEEYAAE